MQVLKRGSRGYEAVHFDKITERITVQCSDLEAVDASLIAQMTIKNLYNGIATEEIDTISASQAEALLVVHPNYGVLAGRIAVSNMHKTTPNSFSACMAELAMRTSVLNPRVLGWIADNAEALDSAIDHGADYNYDYFGVKILERSYLHKYKARVLGADGQPIYVDAKGAVVPSRQVIITRSGRACQRINDTMISLQARTVSRVLDRPQYMLMRVAVALWYESDDRWATPDAPTALDRVLRCYRELSDNRYIHATPTLLNACATRQQLGSCFLFGVADSIEDIMDTVKDCSLTSKEAGGIGIWYHKVRPCGAWINGTNGPSSGIINHLKIFNATAVAWDQGSKRKGAFAIYLEPWHGDIMRFLKLKLTTGADSERARDLFYALWVPDLFVKRARARRSWSLFSADDAPGLADVYDGMIVCSKCGYCDNNNYAKYCGGSPDPQCSHTFAEVDAFTRLYESYEADGMAISVINAWDVIEAVCEMQRESGTPYICFKDHVNRASNQRNIDTIRSSNLCAEIMEVSTENDYAACTLASINLPRYIVGNGDSMTFDHAALHNATRAAVRNLNRVIDVGVYPTDKCSVSTYGHRPIAIGEQGLADVFAKMRLPFLSASAERLDLDIAETMYHAAVTESASLARVFGNHAGFEGSPCSGAILQPDLWLANNKRAPKMVAEKVHSSGRYDMVALANYAAGGMRNSLLRANMPTVSTSQILGNNESFEPFSSNLYTKNTNAGKFTVVNKHMVKHLIERGEWSESVRLLLGRGGRIDQMTHIPADVREIYKTVYDIPQSSLMHRAARRAAFIDQSQSLNIHLSSNANAKLTGTFFAGWEYGLKTGSYYVRTEKVGEAMKTDMTARAAAVVEPACEMCAS